MSIFILLFSTFQLVYILISFIKVQNEVFGSFEDQNKQTWSLKLASKEAASRFSMHLAIAKALSDDLSAVVIQDVETGSGQDIEKGDKVEIKYSGHLVTDGKVGKMFDSNLASKENYRFQVGEGKVVKGMDDGIVGMKKKGRRIIVIPPQFGYKDKTIGDSIPAGSTLVFQVCFLFLLLILCSMNSNFKNRLILNVLNMLLPK